MYSNFVTEVCYTRQPYRIQLTTTTHAYIPRYARSLKCRARKSKIFANDSELQRHVENRTPIAHFDGRIKDAMQFVGCQQRKALRKVETVSRITSAALSA
ncbi:unnamed protein product [Ceratitis capitata]|uniref:(Mediterranean fruit fly) hypothetical protein n=1 Tax=Ceratitis capitata TaxID=7213 RepID=A0A811UPS8_CERCA|nr:unnamed protein product [Ceratitis capitata]